MGIFDFFKAQKDNKSEATEAIPEDLLDELEDVASFALNSGFYSDAEGQEIAMQSFEDIFDDYDIDLPDVSHLEKLIEKVRQNKIPIGNKQQNFKNLVKVFDALNSENIIALHHAGYTLDDGFAEVGDVFQFMKENSIPRRGYCFYHEQDIERAMDAENNFLLLAFHSMNGDEDTAIDVGKRVVELLELNGFEVDWDGSLNSRIKIKHFIWDKVYDGENYGVERAIQIMKKGL